MEQSYIGRKIILDENVEDSALIKFEGIYWTFKSVSGPLKKGDTSRDHRNRRK